MFRYGLPDALNLGEGRYLPTHGRGTVIVGLWMEGQGDFFDLAELSSQ